jgi:hypothetical protein
MALELIGARPINRAELIYSEAYNIAQRNREGAYIDDLIEAIESSEPKNADARLSSYAYSMVKPHSQLKLIGLRGLFRHSSGAPDCRYSDRFLEPA